VRFTVNLKSESVRRAEEVDNVWPDRVLASKPQAANLSLAEHVPQRTFRPGGVAPESARTLHRLAIARDADLRKRALP